MFKMVWNKISRKNVLSVILSAVLLCSCGGGDEIMSETAVSESETVTTTFNEYILVRYWTADELLDSIFFGGKQRPLPFIPEENGDYVFSDETMIFPDGTFVTAEENELGEINALRFDAVSAPADFSVYGIDFYSRPRDIPDKVGIADSIYGNTDETIVYSFYGGGITELTFTYTEMRLESVYIKVQTASEIWEYIK